METFKLDILFFMNWYGYQEETVVVGKNVDILQVMSVSFFFLNDPFHTVCARLWLTELIISMLADFRCWGLLSVTARVGALRVSHSNGDGDYARRLAG